ncbi:MAG: hypothetical protein ABSE82_13665 [Nitrososphaerales archaeon]|jgi:hypothetical protein
MGKRGTIKTNRRSVGENLLRAALEHAYYQESRLTELSHQEFPFPDSTRLVDILVDIHEAIMDELDSLLTELERNPGDADSQRDAEIGARRFGYLLAFLHDTLELLEFSSRAHLSQASVHLIEGLTTKVRKRQFILMPAYEYNYSYRDIMAHILRATTEAFEGTHRRIRTSVNNIAVLSYPNIYRENVLANCLLGHEIGHFVVEQSGMVDRVMAPVQFDREKLERLVEQYKTQRVGPQTTLSEFLSDEVLRLRINKVATPILKSWIDELASDIFAIRILGPVFIFSLGRILLTLEEMDKWSDDHPSARTRLALLLDQNTKLGFMPELKSVKGDDAKIAVEIVAYFDQVQELVTSRREAGTELDPFRMLMGDMLNEAVNRIRTSIIEEVDQMIVNQRYQKYFPGTMTDDIFVMHESLSSFVPPCDDSQGMPGDVVSILNAGMAFMISGKEKYYKYFKSVGVRKEVEAEMIISQLIVKGIELSYLERRLAP